jgi:DNA-binding NarL/FixJ family response regulator
VEQKRLTPRQAELLIKVAGGMTYEKIAEDCFISVKTVTSAMSEARNRLNVRNNVQCFAVAIWRKELSFNPDGTCYVSSKIYERSTDA